LVVLGRCAELEALVGVVQLLMRVRIELLDKVNRQTSTSPLPCPVD
jgi:hypothetical protein